MYCRNTFVLKVNRDSTTLYIVQVVIGKIGKNEDQLSDKSDDEDEEEEKVEEPVKPRPQLTPEEKKKRAEEKKKKLKELAARRHQVRIV